MMKKNLFSRIFLLIFLFCSTHVHASSVTRATISGSALRFDGDRDYVMANHSSSFDINSQLTISAWYKPFGANGAGGTLLNKWRSGFEDKQFTITNSWMSMYLYPSGGGSEVTGTLTFGNWYHFAMSYNGSSIQYYLDGVLIGSDSLSGSVNNNTGRVFIGNNYDRRSESGNYGSLNGVLDEVRFYTRTLSGTEIQQEYNDGIAGIKSTVDSTALQAAWSFDEGEGTITSDSSGNGNTGFLGADTNAPQWVSIPVPATFILISLGLTAVARRFRKQT